MRWELEFEWGFEWYWPLGGEWDWNCVGMKIAMEIVMGIGMRFGMGIGMGMKERIRMAKNQTTARVNIHSFNCY